MAGKVTKKRAVICPLTLVTHAGRMRRFGRQMWASSVFGQMEADGRHLWSTGPCLCRSQAIGLTQCIYCPRKAGNVSVKLAPQSAVHYPPVPSSGIYGDKNELPPSLLWKYNSSDLLLNIWRMVVGGRKVRRITLSSQQEGPGFKSHACGLPPGTLVSSHSPKSSRLGYLEGGGVLYNVLRVCYLYE